MVLALNKEKIGNCFLRSLPSYDEAAVVQNRLARRLLQTISNLPDTAFRNVLEVGCGTGVLSEMLCENKPVQTLWLNDLLVEFEEGVRSRLARFNALKCRPCFGDIETLVLPSDLSLLLSGATFQWLDDLQGFLANIAASLPKGVVLAFSLFGQGTLKEFAELTQVQLNYHSDAAIFSFLEKDFVIETSTRHTDTLYFATVRDILNHIRATGIGGISGYQWTRESLRRFEKRYLDEFIQDQGLPVSYVSSCYMARRR